MRLQKKLYDYLLPISRKNKFKNTYITCSGRNDGLGAQIHSILSVLLVAKQYNLTYVHTPFHSLDHNRGKEKFFEDIFNIGQNEINISELKSVNLTIIYIKHPYQIKNRENTLYITQSCHQYADKYPDQYLNVRDSFKNKFYNYFKNNYKNYNKSKSFNIALHIRRGDVSKDKNEIRFTNNLYYLYIIKNIIKILDSKNIEINIHLYSQGTECDFKEFKDFNIVYHLDECLFTTFYNLIESDMLVMSKSSLSYSAALLNENIVMYQEFWHKPLATWNKIEFKDNDIYFDETNLTNQILKLLKKKKNYAN